MEKQKSPLVDPSEIWAVVSVGVSPNYIRFFASKAEVDAYEWKHPDIPPRKFDPEDMRPWSIHVRNV